MFGGTFAGGGYGGYGGTGQAPPDGESDRSNAFGGGAFGGGPEGGSFNSLPGGGGFGGADYGAATNMQASQGLGGFFRPPGGQAEVSENTQRNQQLPKQGDQQSLMPLTLRMLLDAYAQRTNDGQSGQDAPLKVNGKDIFCFTFVGCLDAVSLEQIYKVFVVNDGSAKIQVKQYHDPLPGGQQDELRVGEYVRVYGTFRMWGTEYHVSAHHIGRIDNPNEIPFHFIEVAHVHLSLAGRIQSKPSPAAGQGVSSPNSTACFKCGQSGHWAKDCPSTPGALPTVSSNQPSFGSAPPAMSGFGQQQSNTANTFPGAPGSFGAVRSTEPFQPPGGGGSSAGQSGGCFKCGQSGHWARDCPNSAGPSSGAQRTPGAGECFKCGQSGHWSRDCPNANARGSFPGGTSPGLGLSGAYGGGTMGSGVQRGFEPF